MTAPIPHLSASQIETFSSCKRKWAFARLDGIREADTKAQGDGKLVHLYLEHYYRHGTLPAQSSADFAFHAEAARTGCTLPGPGDAWSRMATAMIARLAIPPKHPAIHVEHFFAVTLGRVRIVGYMDLYAKAPHTPPCVIDHKTTSSMGWAKTAEDLKGNAQSVIYALYGMKDTGQHECSLWWNYRIKGGTKGEVVKQLVTLADIENRAEEIFAIGDEMIGCHVQPPEPQPGPDGRRYLALALEPNGDTCASFGGCPYKEICGEIKPPSIAEMFHRRPV